MKNQQLLSTINLSIFSTFLGVALTPLPQVVAQTHPPNIPEISWSSSLTSFRLDEQSNIGKTFVFKCPPASASNYLGGVTGSDNYKSNSDICSSAVHAGMITRQGGTVTLHLDGGQAIYSGSEHNGVKSYDAQASDRSFFFVGTPVVDNNNNSVNSNSSSSQPPNSGGNSPIFVDGGMTLYPGFATGG